MSGEGRTAHPVLGRRSTAGTGARRDRRPGFPVNEFGGTYNGRLWAWNRAGIGVPDQAAHPGCVNRYPLTDCSLRCLTTAWVATRLVTNNWKSGRALRRDTRRLTIGSITRRHRRGPWHGRLAATREHDPGQEQPSPPHAKYDERTRQLLVLEIDGVSQRAHRGARRQPLGQKGEWLVQQRGRHGSA